ncbi:MAG: GDP-L-fucose synthase [Candidatus Latescibacteria bacterium ADurb.Bin168]|nr:MAG: GDP-L-fucose synthase [Candidatus Latescibacteria bacterium ADurb.Bin168]
MASHTAPPFMPTDARIYVPGHRGLVGSAIVRRLESLGYRNLLLRARAELDLLDARAVAAFFAEQKPEFVFVCAAKVGGIMANNTFPAEFFYENVAIETAIMHEAWRNGVRRLLFLGSSCIYPRDCPQPIREEYLMTGPLEPTNRAYAIAKIAGIEMCRAYNQQYGTRYLAAMPTNLYGQGDNYDVQTSHVLPALIRKMHEAKIRGDASVTLWGTGRPYREFLYSDDLADACVFLLNLDDERFEMLLGDGSANPLINVGCGEDLTIAGLAELVKEVVGFNGTIVWDAAKPDGTPRKLLDVSKLNALGWRPSVSLREGITRAYRQFLEYVESTSELR